MQKSAISSQPHAAFSPWRRYLAWQTDYALCMALVYALAYGLLRISPITQSRAVGILLAYAAAGAQMVMEPLLLHAFGMTVGKALMGLRVRSEAGNRPTLEQARVRTWQRFVYGLGGMAPVLQLVCAWKNGYTPCKAQEMCRWDSENELVCDLRDRRRWRAWACGAAIVAALALNTAFVVSTAQPPCRAPLTVAQFAQNYNYLTRYYNGSDAYWLLNDQAAWTENAPANVVVIQVGEQAEQPVCQFEVDEVGHIVRAQLEITFKDSKKAVFTAGIQERAMLGAMALAGAQNRDCGLTALRVARAFETRTGDMDAQWGGVHVVYCQQLQNMAQADSGILIPSAAENSVTLSLQIEMGAEKT